MQYSTHQISSNSNPIKGQIHASLQVIKNTQVQMSPENFMTPVFYLCTNRSSWHLLKDSIVLLSLPRATLCITASYICYFLGLWFCISTSSHANWVTPIKMDKVWLMIFLRFGITVLSLIYFISSKHTVTTEKWGPRYIFF